MTMTETLNAHDWEALLRMVFAPREEDRCVAILVDVPDARVADRPAWRERRALAKEWRDAIDETAPRFGFEAVELYAYPNVGSNNADLPGVVYRGDDGSIDVVTADRERLEAAAAPVPLDSVLERADILLLPTEFSATAPMKLGAKRFGYRAATMPGFSRAMMPALRVDFDELNRRLDLVKAELDAADTAVATFTVDNENEDTIRFDLRYRTATASGGLLRESAMAGNLPSGETYIVPFEGKGDDRSTTEGVIPVQFGDEIVRYRVVENRAVEVIGDGPQAAEERQRLADEPAYGNIAELGFGVLRDFSIPPVGEILLDEKLGFHVAFGRSDHFGGAVGAADFRDPSHVIHIDRIYIPETQPRVEAREVRLVYPDGRERVLIERGSYSGIDA